jgi:quaternary ammonium compound-resistance protein SugE
MPWTLLLIAGLFEVGWAVGLKYSRGLTLLWPSVWTVASMVVSLYLLGLALRTLPVGSAYSVWVGVGAVGTVLLGILLFKEPVSGPRLLSVALVIAGIVGIKRTSPAS